MTLHWADAASADLAGALLDLPDRTAVMIVAAFRPDPQSSAWEIRMKGLADFPHRTIELPLGPLPADACHQLFDMLLPSGAVDDVTKQGMIDRSEGNPLFLEELLRNLQETGAAIVPARGACRSATSCPRHSRAFSLRASIDSLRGLAS